MKGSLVSSLSDVIVRFFKKVLLPQDSHPTAVVFAELVKDQKVQKLYPRNPGTISSLQRDFV